MLANMLRDVILLTLYNPQNFFMKSLTKEQEAEVE